MGFKRNNKKQSNGIERKVLRKIFGPTKRWYMENQNKR
jgi:hypothetical protein